MSGKNEENPQVQNEIESKQERREKPKRRIYRKRNKKPEIAMQPEINDPQYYWTDQEDFVVERIIREEVWDNKRYYLVKWKGFDITMSTWEEVQKFKHMQDLIDSFNRSQKGKRDRSIQESCNAMMNPYRATQIHGHFLYGDEPNQIVNTFVEYSLEGKKTIYLEVSWKNRKVSQGYLQLQNSILSSDTVFEHNPQFLLQFYKRNIELKPQN